MTQATQGSDLTRKTIKGFIWSALSFAAGKGLTFLSTIILARLLAPDDFGLMTLGLMTVAFLDTFGELGVGNVVIYRQDDLEKNSNVAFTLGLLVNSLLALASFLAAPFLAAFFKDPRVTDILRVLSLTLIISGLGSIHQARLDRDLQFKRSFIPETGKTLAKALVSIGLALAGFGVWSLVWGQFAASLTASALYWIISRWRPRLDFDLKFAIAQLRYSGNILLVEIMGIIQSNLDYFIIGLRFNTTLLGYYTIAYRIPELLIIYACSMVSKALFPAFSKLQDNLETLRKGYLNTLQYVSIYTIPAGIGIALVSSEFVQTAYGDQWLPAIPVMQILSLYAIMYSLAYNAGDVYKATGRPDILAKVSLVELLIAVPLLWFFSSYGILYVAVAHLTANTILVTIKLIVAARLVRFRFSDILRALQPSITASAIMFLAVSGLRLLLMDFSPILRLLFVAAGGGLVYVAALWLFNREVALFGVALLRRTFAKKLAPTPP
jgi:PST family polysaccharide transporter